MAFGALIAAAGVVLFYLEKGSGQNRFVLWGQTIEVATPALVIIILGCGIVVLPPLLPFLVGPQPPVPSPEPHPVPKSPGPETVSRQTKTAYWTTTPGVSAQITKFAYRSGTASIEITFRNMTDHDSNFCTQPDTWRITDELNHVSCGWPLSSSSGSAICDGADWKEMRPGDAVVASAEIRCPTGRYDTWSFYAPDLKQVAQKLRFDTTP